MKWRNIWILVGLLGLALGGGDAARGARSIFDMDGPESSPGYIPENAKPKQTNPVDPTETPTTTAPSTTGPSTTRPASHVPGSSGSTAATQGASTQATASTKPVGGTTQVASSQPAPHRPAQVPGDSEQVAASKLVRELFKADYARATDPAGKCLLSRKLGKQGAATQDDPVARYVLFLQARELAVEAGEARLALDAMNALEWYFELKDANGARIQTLSRLVPTATPESSDLIVSNALDLISDAIFADDYTALNRLTATVSALKPKVKNEILRARVIGTLRDVQTFSGEYPRVKIARELLKTKPDDPSANLTLGRYLCWAKENWAHGLACLAKSGDADLKAAALRDLTNPTDPQQKVAVADSWSERADKDATNKPWLQKRALKWYKEALPGMRGLAQVKVKQRIRAIEGFGRVNLIALLDPVKDKSVLVSEWNISNGELTGRTWNTHHVEFPYTPPEEYDLWVEFTVPENNGSNGSSNLSPTIGVLVSRDKTQVAWYLGLREVYYGLLNPDTFDATKPGIYRKAARPLPAGRHTTMVRVRRDKIQTFLDDEMVIEYRTNGGMPVQIIRHPLAKGYGLGLEYAPNNMGSPMTFHKVECIEVTGEGHLLHAE